MWNDITGKCGTSTNELRERYDAVLHLVSAADGAEQYYTVATNSARYEQANEEGLQLARDLDKKVNKAWSGHPHLRVINNHDDFDAKLRRVILEISNVLGLPQPVTEERMYMIELTGELPECIESEITQTYLVADPDCEVRLRRRSWGGEVVNVHKTKKRVSPTEVLETERQVSNALYESLLQQADPYRSTIRKTRRSFIWKGQYFEIDFFHAPVDNLMILQTKGVAEQEDVNFPPFIKVIEDITGKKEICKRENMMKLLKRCYRGEIDCIAVQTRAFLAANHKEFCYLIFFLFSLPFHIDIITEDGDYNIDTIRDYDNQSQELYKWASEYISLNEADYFKWKSTIMDYVCDIK